MSLNSEFMQHLRDHSFDIQTSTLSQDTEDNILMTRKGQGIHISHLQPTGKYSLGLHCELS